MSKHNTNFDNIESLIEMYCFHLDEVIMESRTEEDLDDELFNLKSIEIKQLENIYYKTNNKFIYHFLYYFILGV